MPNRPAVRFAVRPRTRTWLVALGVLAVTLSLATVVAPGTARAATDGGTLTSGAQVTATFAGRGDVVTYTVLVPAHQRLTLTAGDSTVPAAVYLAATTPDRGWPITETLGDVGVGSYAWFAKLVPTDGAPTGAADVDRTMTLTLTSATGAGSLPFTPNLVTDPAVAPLALNTPTPVQITAAGQQVPFTVPQSPGHLIGVKVTAVDVTGAHTPADSSTTHPYAVTVTAPGGASTTLDQLGGGLFRPHVIGAVDAASPDWQVFAGAVNDGTGSYVVEAVDALTTSRSITLGTAVSVDASAPLTEAQFSYRSQAGQRLVLTVSGSSLAHSDGTPGSAVVPGLGTITNQPVQLAATSAMLTTIDTQLIIRTDGDSTGSITVTLGLAETPTVPLTLGTPGTATIPTANQDALFTVPVTLPVAHTFTITGASLASPTDPSLVTSLYVFQPGSTGYSYVTTLSQTATSKTFTLRTASDTPAGDLTVLVDPGGDITGGLTLRVS